MSAALRAAIAVIACVWLCALTLDSGRAGSPVEAFADLPAITGPALSPDGKYLAAVQTIDGKPIAAIYQVNAPQGTRPALVTSPDGIIVEVTWAKSDRLVIVEKADMRVHSDKLRTWWRALSVDPQGKNAVLLFNGDKSLAFNVGTASISDVDLDDPDHVFMPIYMHGNDRGEYVVELDRVNVRDGHAEPFISGTMFSAGWVMDGHGHPAVRYAYAYENAIRATVPQGNDWRDVAIFKRDKDEYVGPEGISEDGASLVAALTDENGRDGLFAISMQNATPTILFSNPEFDVDDAIHDEWTGRVIGVEYIDDKAEFRYFDPVRQRLQSSLESAFPGRSVRLVSNDVARSTYIVETDSPREPQTYYYFDVKTKHASVIGTGYPQLASGDLGAMKPYPYRARDGLDIHAYLTLPPGSDGKNLPLVVMPHGGPRERDRMRFDWWAQFIANRGYAVFQPNFRGSSGYGEAFADAGHGQWGLKMEDDITDGVQRLIADGVADPKRICIVGASYGGYAALAGAAFTPGLYACAASYAGVFDLERMLTKESKETGENSSSMRILKARIGDPYKDEDHIAAISPSGHANAISIPILLMAATNDTTVPIEQSQLMRDALVKAQKNVQFLAIEGDDHYLALASTRVRVLSEIEKFLAANIGPAPSQAH